MNEKKFQELVKKADLHEGSAVEVVYDEASINKLSTYVCRAVGFLASIEINILRTNVVLYPLKKTIPVVNVQTINDKPETPIKIDIPLTVIHHIEPLDVRKGFSIIDSMAGCLDFLSHEEEKDVKVSEKEIASGKCKSFKNAKELIADLHDKRKRSVRKK